MIDNPFRAFWELGYRRLVPVVPPDAEVSPHGALARRMAAGEDPRGKAPGVKRDDGLWTGLNFVAMEAQEPDLDAWHGMGASVGVKLGEGLIAVDIDTRDRDAAQGLYGLAQEILGPARPRFGLRPKCLLLYEAPKDTRYQWLAFSTPTEEKAKVEILTEGRQFVAHGVHPRARKPYAWPMGVPRRDELSSITAEDLAAFLKAAREALPGARAGATGAGQAVDQDALRAPSWEALSAAVAAIPNTSAMFPDRDDYVRMAYALKAAAPDGHEDAARDLFLDWCDRWAEGDNDPDVAAEDWERAKPPYRVGWEWLQSHAVGLFFQKEGADGLDDLFSANAAATGEGPGSGAVAPQRTSVFAPASTLADRELKDREWVVEDLIPANTVTMLGGDGGTGKSTLAQQLTVAAATGTTWIGKPVRHGPVIFLSAEDDTDELHRRFDAILKASGQSYGDLGDLIFRSVAGEDALLAALDRGGVLRPTALFAELDTLAAARAPTLIALDTLADLHSGDENNRAHARQFIGLLRGLALRHKTAVLLLAHPSLAGMNSGSGLSGSTAWNGSVRSRLYLERITEDGIEPNPDARRLSTKKANYARTGAEIELLWRDGVFVEDPDMAGPLAAVGASEKAQRVFINLLRRFAREGRYVSAQPGVSYAPRRFAEAGAEGCTTRALTLAMEALFRAGRLRVAEHGRASKRRTHIEEVPVGDDGFPVETSAEDNMSAADEEGPGVFE